MPQDWGGPPSTQFVKGLIKPAKVIIIVITFFFLGITLHFHLLLSLIATNCTCFACACSFLTPLFSLFLVLVKVEPHVLNYYSYIIQTFLGTQLYFYLGNIRRFDTRKIND